jgi:hypothetical protein
LNKNAIKGRISGNDLLKQTTTTAAPTGGAPVAGSVPEDELDVPFPPIQREV